MHDVSGPVSVISFVLLLRAVNRSFTIYKHQLNYVTHAFTYLSISIILSFFVMLMMLCYGCTYFYYFFEITRNTYTHAHHMRSSFGLSLWARFKGRVTSIMPGTGITGMCQNERTDMRPVRDWAFCMPLWVSVCHVSAHQAGIEMELINFTRSVPRMPRAKSVLQSPRVPCMVDPPLLVQGILKAKWCFSPLNSGV